MMGNQHLRNTIFAMVLYEMLAIAGAFVYHNHLGGFTHLSSPFVLKHELKFTCPNPAAGGTARRVSTFQLAMKKSKPPSSPSSSRSKTNRLFNFFKRKSSSTAEEASGERYASFMDDLEMDIPPINVQPRPIVSLDSTTGTYNPPSRSPLSGNGQDSKQHQKQQEQSSKQVSTLFTSKEKNKEEVSGWDQLKEFVYDIVDSISNILSLFTGSGRNKTQNNSILDRKLAIAYSDTVEFKSQQGGGIGRPSLLSVDRDEKKNDIVRLYESSLKASNDDRSNGEDFFKSGAQRNFEIVKDGIYDLFSTGKKEDKESSSSTRSTTTTTKKKSPLLAKLSIQGSLSDTGTIEKTKDYGSIKPISKPSTNKDDMVTSITPYLADLDSPNPIKVLKAKFLIAAEERKRKRRLQEQKRIEAIDGAKNAVYSFIDSIQSTYKAITEIPQRIEDALLAIEEAFAKTTEQTRKSAQEVQALPTKIQLAVEDTKKSIEETKRATMEIVAEVKSIPEKVENTVNEVKKIPERVEKKVADTKASIKETKEGVERAVQRVEDLTYEAKVLAGLEKPKPKPPPPPPPPKTNAQIAWDVAGTVAKNTGKAAWFLGKGTVGLTVSAAQAAIKSATSSKPTSQPPFGMKPEAPNQAKNIEKKDKVEAIPASSKGSLLSKFANVANTQTEHKGGVDVAPPVATEVAAPQSIDMEEIDPLLEKEVRDALKSAEEALDSAKLAAEANEDTLKTIDIIESLNKAKMAAAKARKDADELEDMLEKRRRYFTKQ